MDTTPYLVKEQRYKIRKLGGEVKRKIPVISHSTPPRISMRRDIFPQKTNSVAILHLREFMDVETRIERLTYVYQYMDTNGNLVFRYDNTGHHKKLGLQTYPHHKHDGGEGNVVASSAPDLAEVLDEIEGQVQLPQE